MNIGLREILSLMTCLPASPAAEPRLSKKKTLGEEAVFAEEWQKFVALSGGWTSGKDVRHYAFHQPLDQLQLKQSNAGKKGSLYGWTRWHFDAKGQPYRVFHAGIDLAAPAGSPVYAPYPARVRKVDYVKGYGNCIYLDLELPGNIKRQVRFAHLQRVPDFQAGDQVGWGEVVGHVGNSGNADIPHLHLEVRDLSRYWKNPRKPNAWTTRSLDPIKELGLRLASQDLALYWKGHD